MSARGSIKLPRSAPRNSASWLMIQFGKGLSFALGFFPLRGALRVTPREYSPVGTTSNSPAVDGASVGKLLRETEKDIARLERQSQKLSEKILATEDYVEAGKLNKEFQALRAQLAEAEDRWLALSEI